VVRRFRPDVLQSWLYHADLLGCIAARVHGGSKLVWNVRCSNMDVSRYGIMTRLAIRACAALSSLPDKIVVNSHSGLRFHAALGYKAARCVVVPNGFDPERFKPDPDARRAVREALGAGPQARLVGVGARYDPMKGHAVFLRAAGSVARAVPEARFVLFGEGMDERNPELMHASRQEGVLNRLILLGRRSDVAEVMNALDLLVLPSIYGEGLPNIVGEAMACGVPCVVSDVGDAARLVGETGVVVPPGEADSLAEGVLALLARPAEELGALGRAARERIAQQYDLRGMGRQYEELYEQLARPV
jgi:glycosyltransferase involved in cell wall biosynthesis